MRSAPERTAGFRGGRGLLIRLIVDIREDASEFRVSGLRVVGALVFGLIIGAREFRVGGLRVVGALFFGRTFGMPEFWAGRLRVVGALFTGFIVGAREFGVGRIRERCDVFPRFLFVELGGRRSAIRLALRRRVCLLPGGGDFVRWRSTLLFRSGGFALRLPVVEGTPIYGARVAAARAGEDWRLLARPVERQVVLGPADRYVQKALIERRVRERLVSRPAR